MVHVPMPLAVGAMMEVRHEVNTLPGSGYLSAPKGAKVKVLYVGSKDEEGRLGAGFKLSAL